jgi:hypothetical protein
MLLPLKQTDRVPLCIALERVAGDPTYCPRQGMKDSSEQICADQTRPRDPTGELFGEGRKLVQSKKPAI